MTNLLSGRLLSPTMITARQWVFVLVVMATRTPYCVQCGKILKDEIMETATVKFNTVHDVTRDVDSSFKRSRPPVAIDEDSQYLKENPVVIDEDSQYFEDEVGDQDKKKNGDESYLGMARYSTIELKELPRKEYQDMVVLSRDVRVGTDDSKGNKGGKFHLDKNNINDDYTYYDKDSDNNNKNDVLCTQVKIMPVTNSSADPGCVTSTNASAIPGQQRYSKLYNTVACTLSAIIFVFGLLGNILVIIVISRTRSMHTTTNCYLLSLSVADSLVLFAATLPAIPETFFRVDEWPYGRVMCSMLIFLQYLGIDSSSLSITAFTIERYIAICHPMRAQTMCTLSRAKKIIAALWAFTILYCAPWLGLTEIKMHSIPDQEPMYRCQGRLARSSYLLLYMIDLILFYVIPLLIAIILYFLIGRILFFSRSISKNIQFTGRGMPRKVSQRRTDSRVQVVRMLVVVVVVFATLWMPYRVMVVYNSFAQHKYMDLWFLLFARTMIYINCAINPILYNIMSVKFKRAFRNYLSCWRRRESLPATSCNDMNTDVWATRRNTNNTTIRQTQQMQQQQQQQQQNQQHHSHHNDNGSGIISRRFLDNNKSNSSNSSIKSNAHISSELFVDRHCGTSSSSVSNGSGGAAGGSSSRSIQSSSRLNSSSYSRASQKLMLASSLPPHGQSDNMVDIHHHQSLSLQDNINTSTASSSLITNNSPLLENSV